MNNRQKSGKKLQGIWNDSLTPPWDSKFTININTEMNYWVAESGNLQAGVIWQDGGDDQDKSGISSPPLAKTCRIL